MDFFLLFFHFFIATISVLFQLLSVTILIFESDDYYFFF